MKRWLLATTIAFGMMGTTASLADIQDLQAQPTLYWNLEFDGSGDDTTDSALGFRVDYDTSQISRRLNRKISFPAMLKAEYSDDGKVYLYSNGIPLNNHDYRLNADGDGGFGALDFVGLLGALAAGYYIYDNITDDNNSSNNTSGNDSNPGSNPDCTANPTADGCIVMMCTDDSECDSGTCLAAGVCLADVDGTIDDVTGDVMDGVDGVTDGAMDAVDGAMDATDGVAPAS